MVLKQLNIHRGKKKKLQLKSFNLCKHNSKYSKDLHVKYKNKKLSRKNIGQNFQDPLRGKEYLDLTPLYKVED